MMQAILVPLDGSRLAEEAVPTALDLVSTSNGRMILLRIQRFPAISRRQRERVRRSLERIARRFPIASIRCEVRSGQPSRVIVKSARREAADLIVMSSHGRGGFKEWAFGSVAEQVLRTADRPVLVLRGSRRLAAPRRILVALSGSDASLRILPAVWSIAAAKGLEVLLLHVGRKEPKAFAKAIDALSRYGVRWRKSVTPGEPARKIQEVAAREDVDCVALAPSEGLFFGPVAERILREIDRPVLVAPEPR